jgi:hypothetical protein
MLKKAFIIMSGYNTRALTAFCRKLTYLHEPFYIIASGKDDFIFYTAYRRNVAAIRAQKDLDWNDFKQAFSRIKHSARQDEFILCPSSEYLNNFALEKREKLKELGISLPLVNKNIYRKVSNKLSFSNYCKKQGLSVPKYLEKICEKNIPFVSKPIENIRQGKTLYPYLVLNRNNYRDFLSKEKLNDYYFEQYLYGGESFYLLFYISPYGNDIRFSQKNILQQSHGKSIVLAYPADLHHQPVADLYVAALRKIGFWGLIMIELQKKDDHYIMIEANPRLWGPSQLFVDNSQPLFDAFIFEATKSKPFITAGRSAVCKTPPMQLKPYLWIGGILRNISAGHRLTWHSTESLLTLLLSLPLDVYLRRDTLKYFFKELRMNLTYNQSSW